MKKLIANIKHLPSTIAGVSATVAGIAALPLVQQATSLNPKLAGVVTTVGATTAGLSMIFGMGHKQ